MPLLPYFIAMLLTQIAYADKRYVNAPAGSQVYAFPEERDNKFCETYVGWREAFRAKCIWGPISAKKRGFKKKNLNFLPNGDVEIKLFLQGTKIVPKAFWEVGPRMMGGLVCSSYRHAEELARLQGATQPFLGHDNAEGWKITVKKYVDDGYCALVSSAAFKQPVLEEYDYTTLNRAKFYRSAYKGDEIFYVAE